jgi:hypothetical protein
MRKILLNTNVPMGRFVKCLGDAKTTFFPNETPGKI